MLLCVVGNCLLFYCSCTGNCENCCGINGNASASGSINDKIESEFGNNDKKNKEENKEEKKIEEVKISYEGKIAGKQIVNAEFVKAKLVETYVYKGSSDNDEIGKNEFIKEINPTDETYLSAYVEVKKDDNVVGYFIHCKNANSKKELNVTYGLFHGSEATKIEILSCGSEIEDMNHMFHNCSSLTKIIFPDKFNTNNVKDMQFMFNRCSGLTILDLSNFNTKKVTNMSCMFSYCSSLTELDLSNFNTDNVTDMNFMFNGCSELTNLDLSNFNTNKVKNMLGMFYKCFKEEQHSTLICTASIIKKIAENGNSSYLIIAEKKKDGIKNTLNNSKWEVYKCSVKRVGSNPEITEVVEYKQKQYNAKKIHK